MDSCYYFIQQPAVKMPKKKSSKISNVTKEEPEAAQAQTFASSKKADEIDDIFASRKRKKSEKEKSEKTSRTNEQLRKIKKKKKSNPKDCESFNPDSKPRRRTNDGLAIYSEEELGINKLDGGDTALCPFDCSCCF